MRARPLIVNKQQLLRNLVAYHNAAVNILKLPEEERKAIGDTLRYGRSWIAMEHDGRWIVGPAKFVGYADPTPGNYARDRKTCLHGAIAEREIKKLGGTAYPLNSSRHPAVAALRKLILGRNIGNGTLLSGPNSLSEVFVVEMDTAERLHPAEAARVDLVLKVVDQFGLSPRGKQALAEALA